MKAEVPVPYSVLHLNSLLFFKSEITRKMPYLDIKMEEHNYFTKTFNGNFEKYEYCCFELSENIK